MSDIAVYDLIENRIKRSYLIASEIDKNEAEIVRLQYRMDALKISNETLNYDYEESESRLEELIQRAINEEKGDHKKVAQFVRDAKIRARRGF